jgi:hypothetical protein
MQFRADDTGTMSRDEVVQLAILFIEFQNLVVKCGLDPKDVHREFLKIRQYRQHIAGDCPGAEDQPERPRRYGKRRA